MNPHQPEPDPPEEAGESDFAPFRAPPDAPPIPEALRDGPGPGQGAKPEAAASGFSGMTKAWAVAMDFVFTVIGALLLGYFADRWQQTAPRYALIGLVLGFSFALWRIIRRTLADDRAEQEARRKARSGPR